LACRCSEGFRRELELERRQHVDHERALDELEHTCRVFARTGRENLVMAEVEHRQRGARGDSERGPQNVAACNSPTATIGRPIHHLWPNEKRTARLIAA